MTAPLNSLNALPEQNEIFLIEAFLSEQGISTPHLTLLPKDASKRYYYRVNGENVLVMVADDTQKPEEFKRISQLLLDLGLNAPRVMAESGPYYLMNDFGENTYRRTLTDENSNELYEKAVDVLIHIAQNITNPIEGLASYSQDVLMIELGVFLEWYAPSLDQTSTIAFFELWTDYLNHIKGPQTLILRDFHIDNLFFLHEEKDLKQVGLIDFQDGVFGPAPLDLVSLTEDARIDVSDSIRKQCVSRFIAAFPSSHHEGLLRTAKIIDLVRQLRILGVFMRLAKRDGRAHYLSYEPRLVNYIKAHLKDTFFKELNVWCAAHDLFQD